MAFVTHHGKRPDVGAPEEVIVAELQDEIHGQAAPDGDVVHPSPIRSIQSDL